MVHARRPTGRVHLHPQYALSLARPHCPSAEVCPASAMQAPNHSRDRECHAGGNFRLIYRIENADGPSGSAYFARAGTHRELFE